MVHSRALISGPEPNSTSLDVFVAFVACARRHSAEVAVAEPTRQIHYGELLGLVTEFARDFRRLRRPSGEPVRVALRADPSIPYVAALLALLEQRLSYVPLPLDQPSARRTLMHELAAPVVTLDAWDLEATFERFLAGRSASESFELLPPSDVDQEAYVLFTSGSTGVPKGVRGSARALASRLFWMRDYHALGPGDAVLAKASTGFDVSFVELLGPLISGARVQLDDRDALSRPDRLVATLIEREITTAVLLPAQLEQVIHGLKERSPALRHVFTGGEAFGIDLVRRFSAALPSATLTNGYGPTEATISVTAWRATPSASQVELGSPLPGVHLLVMDEAGRPVERAGRGELWIGGPCLALGYLEAPGSPAATQFCPPSDSPLGLCFYRTGDRVERDDERLTFVGRLDAQVKVRGIRVELGDVEALLRAQPEITEAVVDLEGAGGLVAYFTSSAESVNERALLADLGTRLAEPLLPRLVRLDEWPLDPNGKIDRRTLARRIPSVAGSDRDPSTPLARTRRLWREVLGHEHFDDDSDFFAAGGTSSSILRLLRTWERALGRSLELGSLYEATTPCAQAQLFERASEAASREREDAGTFPFLYLLTHGDASALPHQITSALTRLTGEPIVVTERSLDDFLPSAPDTFVRQAHSSAEATLHSGTRASLLQLALPSEVSLALERPESSFDLLGLDEALRECSPEVRVAPLRDPALWVRKQAATRELPADVLTRTTRAAWRARTRANERRTRQEPQRTARVAFPELERFHGQCLFGCIEAICRTRFGHSAHDAVLGERTLLVDMRGDEVALAHEPPDFTQLRERLRYYHGVEFRRLRAPANVIAAFTEHIENGHPLLVDFDFTHLAHRPEYDAAPSYHPVVLVGVDAARDCFLAHEQTSGLVELPFDECETYFSGKLPNGDHPGIIECSVVEDERRIEAHDVASRLTRSLENLLSAEPARGLGALERAFGHARRGGTPADWSGTWILSHDLFGLERLLARAERDLALDLCTTGDLARMAELRQAWHRVDTMFEHARLTDERRLTALGLEQASRLLDQERSLATRMVRARNRLADHAERHAPPSEAP